MTASLLRASCSVPRLWLLWLALLWVAVVAQAQVALPRLAVPVEDLTGTLSAAEIEVLTQKVRALEEEGGARIAVVIVPTTAPETIEQFAIRLAEQRTLGRKGVDDGVLVILAKEDRAIRIEVGLGLQGVLPDVIANRITDQVMAPQFRQGQFFAGLDAGLDRLVALIKGESLPAPAPAKSKGVGSLFPVLLMLVVVAGGVLRKILGRIVGALTAASIAGVLGWLIGGAFIVGAGAALLAFFVTLLGSGGMGWNSGGRGRFGGGLGGGGGSWGGGGGTFNGGGATGRW